MLKSLFRVPVIAAMCVGFFAGAQQPAPAVKVVPLTPTSSASGKQMFTTYCAACHGEDGKGNGPAAAAMKEPPTDLTVLSKNNNGKFPTSAVFGVLKFGVSETAHGSKEMPVWGAILNNSQTAFHETPGEVQLRLQNLVNYLRSIQQ